MERGDRTSMTIAKMIVALKQTSKVSLNVKEKLLKLLEHSEANIGCHCESILSDLNELSKDTSSQQSLELIQCGILNLIDNILHYVPNVSIIRLCFNWTRNIAFSLLTDVKNKPDATFSLINVR